LQSDSEPPTEQNRRQNQNERDMERCELGQRHNEPERQQVSWLVAEASSPDRLARQFPARCYMQHIQYWGDDSKKQFTGATTRPKLRRTYLTKLAPLAAALPASALNDGTSSSASLDEANVF